MNAAFTDSRFRWAIAGLAAVKLWLVSAQAVFAIGQAAHDDRLFLRLANTFLDGQWLGAYTQLTLAKGPAYSIFVASTIAVGIPLPLAQHLLYLLACWIVVRALRPLLRNDWWAFALAAVLILQPMTYQATVLTRVMRQHVYTPYTLLVFAGLAALVTRASATARVRLAWAALLGLAWGTLWLTREESIWVVPATVMLAAVAVLFGRKTAGSWSHLVPPLGVAVAVAAVPLIIVCAMNARNYGWWGTVEFRAPQFNAAYGALNRVQVGPEIPCVPLTRASREAVYDVSPAFAELRPWLEGDFGESCAIHSKVVTGLDPALREIAGGWWMWALRDAVAFAGHAHSAGEAMIFYQLLADEVNAACDRGALPAGPPRATLFPPWQPSYTSAAWRELPRFVGAVALFSGFNAETPASTGNADSLRLFRDLTQWYVSPSLDAPELNTPTATIARSYRVGALSVVGHAMAGICALLVLAGSAAWLASGFVLARRRMLPSYRWWFASACLGTVLAIIAINLLINVTSFPQFGPGAFSQAYPLILVFAVLGLADFAALRGRGTDSEL